MQFTANRVRGFHIGLEGDFSREFSYRLLGGYRRAWGSGRIPFIEPKNDTSFMIEAAYTPRKLSSLSVKVSFAMDRGELYGNRTGAMLTVSFNDICHLGKTKK
jgi:hypothetical protein